MASTAAVVYVKPRTSGYLTADGSTGAVVYMSPRGSSGRWASGVSSSSDLTNLLALLPQQNQSMGYVQIGNERHRLYIDGALWRYLYQLANVIIGQNPIPLADIVAAALDSIAQAQAVSATVNAVSQQVQQNAATLSAAVEVSQNAALPGATQIPPAQMHIDLP